MSNTDGQFEESEAEPGTGPGAPNDTEEDSEAEPGSGPGAPQR
ncbi:MAG TPA: hypothetical protein VN045_05150 [Microbacteriaceae bacterium]|nr:hypothetical protein [Microbacteriaceae bacterium]